MGPFIALKTLKTLRKSKNKIFTSSYIPTLQDKDMQIQKCIDLHMDRQTLYCTVAMFRPV